MGLIQDYLGLLQDSRQKDQIRWQQEEAERQRSDAANAQLMRTIAAVGVGAATGGAGYLPMMAGGGAGGAVVGGLMGATGTLPLAFMGKGGATPEGSNDVGSEYLEGLGGKPPYRLNPRKSAPQSFPDINNTEGPYFTDYLRRERDY